MNRDKDGNLIPATDPLTAGGPAPNDPPYPAGQPASGPPYEQPFVPGKGTRPTVMDDVQPSREILAEQDAKNADLERSQREGPRGPTIGDQVMFVKDILVGHITSLHSDGSVDITIGSSMVHTSVPHISKVKDPATTLNTKGWYSRQHDGRYGARSGFAAPDGRQVDSARGPGNYDDGRRASGPSTDSPYAGPEGSRPIGGQPIGDRPYADRQDGRIGTDADRANDRQDGRADSDRLVNDRDKGPSDVRPATERDKPYTEKP